MGAARSAYSLFNKLRDTMFGPANKGNIVRFHTTRQGNMNGIAERGLVPRMGGGMQENLREAYPEKMQKGVFTDVRPPAIEYLAELSDPEYRELDKLWTVKGYTPFYDGEENLVTFRLDIPKDEYRKLKRADHNNESTWVPGESMKVNPEGMYNGEKHLQSVMKGGRSDIFEDTIKPEWITSALCADGDGKFPYWDCTDMWKMMKDIWADPDK